MTQICGKRLNFVGNKLDMLETAQICDKWLFMCWKWLKFVGNGLDMWKSAELCGK